MTGASRPDPRQVVLVLAGILGAGGLLVLIVLLVIAVS